MEWDSEKTEIFLNSRLPEAEKKSIESYLRTLSLKGHVWLGTSGSTSAGMLTGKWAALSKKALLTSAAAVNQHLQSRPEDVWINPLPLFHVGGLGILARAHLSGSKVVTFAEKWHPEKFHQSAEASRATLSSLVPTQVYDLVQARLRAPKTLRAVIVGGGALQPIIYQQALQLGWKLLPSYGLTECGSQVATASLDSLQKNRSFPALYFLSHVNCTVSKEGFLRIQSPSLLTTYAFHTSEGLILQDPKQEGWFQTEDLVQILGKELQVLGRAGDLIKIGGEQVHFGQLEGLLESLKCQLSVKADVALVAMPDPRLGCEIHLAVAEEISAEVEKLVRAFQEAVLPIAKIREVHRVAAIPRSALQKLLRKELIKEIQKK